MISPDLRFFCVNDVYKPERLSTLKMLMEKHKIPGMTKLVLPGDFLGGSVFAAKHNGESVLEVLNELHVDYFTMGNHEFDYGAEKAAELMDKSTFAWLGSNIRHSNENREIFHTTKDFDIFDTPTSSAGIVKVGVFGMCSEETPNLSDPGTSIIFEDVMKHSRRCVKILKDLGCEVIVALTHVALHTDKNLAEIPGIDVIIGGHEHTPYLFMQKDTMIVKCGQNVDHLGIMDLNFERDELHNLILIPSFHLLSTKCAKTDPTIDAIIEKWNDIVDPNDEVLTCVGEVAISTLTADCRGVETAFPCMVADAIKYSYRAEKCQLAIQNGGFIRCDNIYPSNSILYKSQVLNEMPFPRKAVLLKMKGEEIKLGLEQMIMKCPEPVGCFPHLSHGWQVIYDLTRPPLDRIISMCYKRRPVDMAGTFHVGIQDFYIDRDGDGVNVFADMEIVAQHGKLVSQCVVEYLPNVPSISGEAPGRFVPNSDELSLLDLELTLEGVRGIHQQGGGNSREVGRLLSRMSSVMSVI